MEDLFSEDFKSFHLDAKERPKIGIAVDVSCRPNPGDMEYRGVDIETGKELFRVGIFSNSTNNIGEFLAIVHGLAYRFREKIDKTIYTDSFTGMSWVKLVLELREYGENEDFIFNFLTTQRITLMECSENVKTFEYIKRAIKWLFSYNDGFTNGSKIKGLELWDTKHWGQITADFGYKNK